MKRIDKNFCMNSFLMYRALVDKEVSFSETVVPYFFQQDKSRIQVSTVGEIDEAIKMIVEESLRDGKCALMLSGGIDSAIIAKYLPKGTLAYTLRCVAKNALDETEQAKKYAEECGLVHKVIDVTWEDYLQFYPILMKHKGAPIHSIEPQIYKAAEVAKKDEVKNLIFGENADIIFGGMDGLVARDWHFDEFVSRYTYVDSSKVLKKHEKILEPFEKYRDGELIDFYGFMCEYFYDEANGSYDNACSVAGVCYVSPYNRLRLGIKLDFERIRKGEPKYLLRELFKMKFRTEQVPPKTPMPRPVAEWLSGWNGPTNDEFKENCIEGLTGDQKWMVYILEMFINMIDKES